MIIENPLGLLALLAIPVVYLLHRLRQRPRRQTVSSLYIWNKIEPYLTSQPAKKPSHLYLILILQILAVTLLALALAKPVWKTFKPQPLHLIFLIDNAVSLTSTYSDENERPNAQWEYSTRWELLVHKIREVIEKAPADSIFSFYQIKNISEEQLWKRKNILQNANLTQAREKADGLYYEKPEMPSDIESLIQMAKGVQGEIYFCSDKMPPESALKELGRKPHFILVGQPSHNKAIIHAAATPVEGKENRYNVFVAIKNYSADPAPEKISVELVRYLLGGKELGTQVINLGGGQKSGVIFKDVYLEPRSLIRIGLLEVDEMSRDNFAFLHAPYPIFVGIVDKKNSLLTKAIAANPSVEIENGPRGDMLIYNEIVPEELTARTVIINTVPNSNSKGDWLKYNGKVANPIIKRIDMTSPILQYCDIEVFRDIPYALAVTPAETDYFRPIIEAEGANGEKCVLLGEWQKGEKHLVLINFPLEWRTETHPNDWTSTPTFPIFWTNIVNYLNPDKSSNGDFVLEDMQFAAKQTVDVWQTEGIALCNEQASDNNGITLIDTSVPALETLPQQEAKRVDFSGWLAGVAGIFLMISWVLRRAS